MALPCTTSPGCESRSVECVTLNGRNAMRSVIPALLLAAALAPLAGFAADDNPLERCKNHYILRQLGCADAPRGWVQAALLRTYHGDHTATLLADERVLVAG